jgi:hypothetical protein
MWRGRCSGTRSTPASWPDRGCCCLQVTFSPWWPRAPRATAAGALTKTRLTSSPSRMGGGGGSEHGGEKNED